MCPSTLVKGKARLLIGILIFGLLLVACNSNRPGVTQSNVPNAEADSINTPSNQVDACNLLDDEDVKSILLLESDITTRPGFKLPDMIGNSCMFGGQEEELQRYIFLNVTTTNDIQLRLGPKENSVSFYEGLKRVADGELQPLRDIGDKSDWYPLANQLLVLQGDIVLQISITYSIPPDDYSFLESSKQIATSALAQLP